MPTNHLISAIFAGAVVVIWLLYLAYRSLGRCRDRAEENKRIYENEYQRPKKP